MEAIWKITYSHNLRSISNCVCSNCNNQALLRKEHDMDGESYEFALSPFCPHCGANIKRESLSTTAKWIEIEDTYGGFVGFRCSCCNIFNKTSNLLVCPSCGRKMSK